MGKIDREKMYHGIGCIDEDLIEEAAAPIVGKKKMRPILLKHLGAITGGLAAAFAILVGASMISPAFAAYIPGMESVIRFLKGKPYADGPVANGGMEPYLSPVESHFTSNINEREEKKEFEITNTYFDGEALVLTTQIALPDAPEDARFLSPKFDLKFWENGKELTPDYESQSDNWVMERMNETTFVGAVMLYNLFDGADSVETELELPPEFSVAVTLESVFASNPQIQVLDEELNRYMPKTWELNIPVQTFSCSVNKDDSLRKVYPVNDTKNGFTLKQVTVSPAWTEIKNSINKEQSDGMEYTVQVYDSQNNELKYLEYGPLACMRFRTPDKNETLLTVRFFDRADQNTPLAEFTVPIQGGYYEGDEDTKWFRQEEIVYDPPLPEFETNTRKIPGVKVMELGETFTPNHKGLLSSGSIEVTFENYRVYDDLGSAGIDVEKLDDWNDPLERMESGENKLVLADITLSAHNAVCPSNYSIENFALAVPIDSTAGEFSGIPEYFSEYQGGYGQYRQFNLGENETKTMTVGFIVPANLIEENNLQLLCPSVDLLEYQEINGGVQHVTCYGYYVNLPPWDQEE